MANVETLGNPDDPIASYVKSKSGVVIDLNNCPGVLRAKMVLSGDMGVEAFVSPANMPGAKLKKMREEFAAKLAPSLAKVKANEDEKTEEFSQNATDFPVGSFVMYKEVSYEVMKNRQDAVLIEVMADDNRPQKVWVKKTNITKG